MQIIVVLNDTKNPIKKIKRLFIGHLKRAILNEKLNLVKDNFVYKDQCEWWRDNHNQCCSNLCISPLFKFAPRLVSFL